MKVQICSSRNADAKYFVRQAISQGYHVYLDLESNYCLDVLTEGPVFVAEDVEFKSVGSNLFVFKE